MSLPTNQPFDIQWWNSELDEGDCAKRLIAHERYLASRNDRWEREDRFHATLYQDRPVLGLDPWTYTNVGLVDDDCARLNLIKAAVDSWVAALCKNIPKPQTVTERGNWDLKRRGDGMNRWLAATFEESDLSEDLAPYCARLAGVHGNGIVKVYEDVPGGTNWKEAKVCIANAFQWDFTFDDAEAQDPRNIRTLYHNQWYDRDVLIGMFPDSADDIRMVATNGDDQANMHGAPSVRSNRNLVRVTEGYRLRSSRDAKDGVRAIAIPGALLTRVPWELDRFPFAVLRRSKNTMGWRGIGLAQELRGRQQFINEVMLAYEEATVFFARPKWMVPRGSAVTRAHLDDRIGSIVEFDGPIAPTMYIPNMVMPPDVMQTLQSIWQGGFEQTGISSMFAGGQVPQGLKSGEAIRRYNDTGQARAVESLKLQERWVVDIAKLCIESGRAIAKENPKYASQFDGGKRGTEVVYFAKVDISGRDKFKLKVFPTNSLSGTLSDKIEQLDLLANHNPPLIDEHTYRVLLDWTDIDEENSLANAPYEILDAILSKAYDADDPAEVLLAPENTPDPFWPLDYMRARCIFAKARAFIDGAPASLLDALGQYVERIQATIDAAKPAPAAPPPGAGPTQGPPMGQPIQQGAPVALPPGAPMPAAA